MARVRQESIATKPRSDEAEVPSGCLAQLFECLLVLNSSDPLPNWLRMSSTGCGHLDSDNFSAISKILRNASGYTRCSHTPPSRPFGSCLEPNYFNEDLQHGGGISFSRPT